MIPTYQRLRLSNKTRSTQWYTRSTTTSHGEFRADSRPFSWMEPARSSPFHRCQPVYKPEFDCWRLCRMIDGNQWAASFLVQFNLSEEDDLDWTSVVSKWEQNAEREFKIAAIKFTINLNVFWSPLNFNNIFKFKILWTSSLLFIRNICNNSRYKPNLIPSPHHILINIVLKPVNYGAL